LSCNAAFADCFIDVDMIANRKPFASTNK